MTATDVYLLTTAPFDARPTLELTLDSTVPYRDLCDARLAALNEIETLYREEFDGPTPSFVITWERREWGRIGRLPGYQLIEDWLAQEPKTRLALRIAHYQLWS